MSSAFTYPEKVMIVSVKNFSRGFKGGMSSALEGGEEDLLHLQRTFVLTFCLN